MRSDYSAQRTATAQPEAGQATNDAQRVASGNNSNKDNPTTNTETNQTVVADNNNAVPGNARPGEQADSSSRVNRSVDEAFDRLPVNPAQKGTHTSIVQNGDAGPATLPGTVPGQLFGNPIRSILDNPALARGSNSSNVLPINLLGIASSRSNDAANSSQGLAGAFAANRTNSLDNPTAANNVQAVNALLAALNGQNLQAVARGYLGLLATIQNEQGAASVKLTSDGKPLITTKGGAGAYVPEGIEISGIKGITSSAGSINAPFLPLSGIRSGIPIGKAGDGSDIVEPGKLPAGTASPLGTISSVPGVQAGQTTPSSQTATNKGAGVQNTSTAGATGTNNNLTDADFKLPNLTIDGLEPRKEISDNFEIENKDPNNTIDINPPAMDGNRNGNSTTGIGASGGGTNLESFANLSEFKKLLIAAILGLFGLAMKQIMTGDKPVDALVMALRLQHVLQRTEYLIKTRESLGNIAQKEYGDPRFAKLIYQLNVSQGTLKHLRIPNEKDINAIRNIFPELGTMLILPSKTEARRQEIILDNAYNNLIEHENFKKDKLTIDSIIPKWIKAIPQLMGINIQLATQLCSLKDQALEMKLKSVISNLVKTGYLTKYKLPERNLSSTGRQFLIRKKEVCIA